MSDRRGWAATTGGRQPGCQRRFRRSSRFPSVACPAGGTTHVRILPGGGVPATATDHGWPPPPAFHRMIGGIVWGVGTGDQLVAPLVGDRGQAVFAGDGPDPGGRCRGPRSRSRWGWLAGCRWPSGPASSPRRRKNARQLAVAGMIGESGVNRGPGALLAPLPAITGPTDATPLPCPGHVRCTPGPRSAHFAPRTGTSHTSHTAHRVRRHPAACAVGLRGGRGHPAGPDYTPPARADRRHPHPSNPPRSPRCGARRSISAPRPATSTPTAERRVSTSARARPGPLRRPRTHLAGSADPAKRQRTLRGPCHAMPRASCAGRSK